MTDYISRESVLQILSGKNAAWDAYQEVQSLPAADVVPMDFHERCLQIEIQKRMALEKADVRPVKWIPVTERLPEEYKDVLCYYEYFRFGEYNCMFRAIDRGYYGDGRWGGEARQGIKNKVLAWMPLPEPPKEE